MFPQASIAETVQIWNLLQPVPEEVAPATAVTVGAPQLSENPAAVIASAAVGVPDLHPTKIGTAGSQEYTGLVLSLFQI